MEQDSVAVARARTLATVCAVHAALTGILWTATMSAVLAEGYLEAMRQRPACLGLLLGALTEVGTGPALALTLWRAPRFVPAALLLGISGGAIVGSSWLWQALHEEFMGAGDATTLLLHVDCAALPLFGAALCGYTWARHGRVFRAGGAAPTP